MPSDQRSYIEEKNFEQMSNEDFNYAASLKRKQQLKFNDNGYSKNKIVVLDVEDRK